MWEGDVSDFTDVNRITLKELERLIKIRTIEGLKLTPSLDYVSKDKLKMVQKNFKDDILTGSFALSFFTDLETARKNMIWSSSVKRERSMSDIDIISKRFSKSDLTQPSFGYTDIDFMGSKTITEYSLFGLKRIHHKVDVFNYDADFIEFEGLKIHNPLDIIRAKVNILNDFGEMYKSIMTYNKHYVDIMHIIG
jgi:hypothetical protein